MMRLFFFLLSLVLLGSCNGKDEMPKGILKPDKMQAVLWDVIKADAFTTEFIKKDTNKNAEEENRKLQQQVFAIHKITRDQFYNSYDYYKTNTTLFKKMLDSMVVQAERNKNANTPPVITPPLNTGPLKPVQ